MYHSAAGIRRESAPMARAVWNSAVLTNGHNWRRPFPSPKRARTMTTIAATRTIRMAKEVYVDSQKLSQGRPEAPD